MKRTKIICIAIFIVTALITTGCAGKNNVTSKEESSINVNQDTENAENNNAPKEADLSVENGVSSADVDVDLTVLSSTMVYAEVYNMMSNPEEYVGKTIKIKGQYYSEYLDDTQKYYHYVIISDATACCQSGIEFIWDDNSHVYPDEYPENETEIEISGVFNSYEELGQKYYYLSIENIKECNE